MSQKEQLLQFYIKQSNIISNRIEYLYQNLDELRTRISNLYENNTDNCDNKNNLQNITTTKVDIASNPSVSLNEFLYSVQKEKEEYGDNSLNPFNAAE
jgi:hypothetical protein